MPEEIRKVYLYAVENILNRQIGVYYELGSGSVENSYPINHKSIKDLVRDLKENAEHLSCGLLEMVLEAPPHKINTLKSEPYGFCIRQPLEKEEIKMLIKEMRLPL